MGKVCFDLGAHVYDYGEAIDRVIIDRRYFKDVVLQAQHFKVLATSTMTDDFGEDAQAGLYRQVEREITKIEVTADTLLLHLHTEYNGRGQATLNYVEGPVQRNISMDIQYDIIATKDLFNQAGEMAVEKGGKLQQRRIINNELSQFEADSFAGIDYRIYKPAKRLKKPPLVIWFHGNGEGGYKSTRNNTSQLSGNRGALAFIEEKNQETLNHPMVLAPQAPDTWFNNYTKDYVKTMYDLIRKLIEEGQVDESRIYAYGASAGGYMIFRMAIEYPGLFAAIVPTCPAIDLAGSGGRSGKVTTSEDLQQLKGQKVWLVHSEDDRVVDKSTMERIVEGLADVIYTPFKTVEVDDVSYPGHASWIYTARNIPAHQGRQLFHWTAEQSLSKQ